MEFIMTPYAASKLANAALLEAGAIEKALPPQMFYNYTTARVNKGKAPLIAYTVEGGVDEADLQRWIATRVAKGTKATPAADPEQESFDLAEAN